MSINYQSLLMTIFSVLSALGTLSIIISFLLFNSIKSKKSYEPIFYYAIATFLTSIGSTVGIPRDGSIACWFEGIVTNIFTLSSIAWILVINYAMYSILCNKQFIISYRIHLLCWTLPIIVTLLPLINTRYGTSDNNWCFLVEKVDTPSWAIAFWVWISFYAWTWSIIVIDIVIYIIGYRIIYTQLSELNRSYFIPIITKLQYYPLIIIICWTLSTLTDVLEYVGYVNMVSNIMPCTQGLLSTFVFWYTLNVRSYWVSYITRGESQTSVKRMSLLRSILGDEVSRGESNYNRVSVRKHLVSVSIQVKPYNDD